MNSESNEENGPMEQQASSSANGDQAGQPSTTIPATTISRESTARELTPEEVSVLLQRHYSTSSVVCCRTHQPVTLGIPPLSCDSSVCVSMCVSVLLLRVADRERLSSELV